ncbi:diguanylate cyclase [Vibrio sp. M260121]|uniref:diguanylate cyclase n=1 Tax=Vibrio sp. M260121 TaxID=3020897 RepID=UPI002F3FF22B
MSVIDLRTHHFTNTQDFLINYTISIGVCEYKSYFESHTQWLKSADAALYRAKENGRNQTCCHEDD